MTDIVTILVAATANVTGPAFDAGDLKSGLTLETITTGSVSAFSVQLQGSLDASSWVALGSPQTTATTAGVSTSTLARYFRAVLSGFTGTGTVTVKLGFTAGTGYTGSGGSSSSTLAGVTELVGTTASSGSGTVTLNVAADNVFQVTLTGSPTLAFSGAPASGTSSSFTLYLVQDGTGGRTVTWPASVTWLAGNAPALNSAAGAVTVLAFQTLNGGTTWYGASPGPSLPLTVANGGTGVTSLPMANGLVAGGTSGTSPVVQVSLSVACATTAALSPSNTYAAGILTAGSNGALTVDGVAVSSGQLIAVMNEAAPANNGVYTVSAPGSVSTAYVLTRYGGMAAGSQVPGTIAYVQSGTANGGKLFGVTGAGPFTIGTTAIPWALVGPALPVGVASGGTGVTSATAYGVVAGGTTSTGAFQNAGVGAAGTVLTGQGAGVLPAWAAVPLNDPTWNPADQGFLAATFDPLIAGTQATLSAAQLCFCRIPLRSAQTIASISVAIQALGTATSGTGTFMGLYTASGGTLTRQAVTADFGASTIAGASTGLLAVPLTAAYTAAAGFIYAAILTNFSGGTGSNLYCAAPNLTTMNLNLSASTARVTGLSAAGTSLSSTYTMSSLSVFTGKPWWMALS